ncbi:MAG: hypothetical protein OK455_08685 [Thaumarchaeota archaeon]|nr:hypothetical protein [Nitrososphaerota archaeon]
MSNSRVSLTITERQSREIEAYCRIAKENGALISLRELIGLASIDASEEEFGSAFLLNPALMSKFILESGYVLERASGLEEAAQKAVIEEDRSKARARGNLKVARAFGRFLTKGTLLVSVSGANSYLSARENEDIDFFCVTKTDGLWPFLLKGLLLARIYRLANREVPELCFSCEMDEKWAEEAFKVRQEPIFARDALTAKLIKGRDALHRLLQEAQWMRGYFPAFYAMRMHETDSGSGDGAEEKKDESRPGSALLNSFLYHTLGSFLIIKSWALNRRITKDGQRSSIFAARINKSCCIYESNRYRNLRTMYGDFDEAPPR